MNFHSTEQGANSKSNDPIFDKELKRQIEIYIPDILEELLNFKLSLSEIGQSLLALYLKDKLILIYGQNLVSKSITQQILYAYKELTSDSLLEFPHMLAQPILEQKAPIPSDISPPIWRPFEENSKSNNSIFEEVVKTQIEITVAEVWGELLDHKLTLLEIGQTLIALYLKDQINSMNEQNSNQISITHRILKASKEITFKTLPESPQIFPVPDLELIAPIPSKIWWSPLEDSAGSADSPICLD